MENFSIYKIIYRIKNCGDEYLSSRFEEYEKAKKCYRSDTQIKNKYCVNVKGKRRYINPLVEEGSIKGRAYDLSDNVRKNIDEYMMIPIDGYTYLDFEFTPYQKVKKRG